MKSQTVPVHARSKLLSAVSILEIHESYMNEYYDFYTAILKTMTYLVKNQNISNISREFRLNNSTLRNLGGTEEMNCRVVTVSNFLSVYNVEFFIRKREALIKEDLSDLSDYRKIYAYLINKTRRYPRDSVPLFAKELCLLFEDDPLSNNSPLFRFLSSIEVPKEKDKKIKTVEEQKQSISNMQTENSRDVILEKLYDQILKEEKGRSFEAINKMICFLVKTSEKSIFTLEKDMGLNESMIKRLVAGETRSLTLVTTIKILEYYDLELSIRKKKY